MSVGALWGSIGLTSSYLRDPQGRIRRVESVSDINNYVDRLKDELIQATAEVDTFMGFDVNDFTSTTTFGVFNDPESFIIGDIINREALRERLFNTPLMEDEDLDRIVRHANLSNEDRERNGQRERVKVRRKVILETDWSDV